MKQTNICRLSGDIMRKQHIKYVLVVVPVQGPCKVNWINIKIIVGVFTRRERIAVASVLTQILHS